MELGEVMSYEFVARVSEKLQFRVVRPKDDPILIDTMKAHRGCLKQHGQLVALSSDLGFVFAQRFVCCSEILVIFLGSQVCYENAQSRPAIFGHLIEGQKNWNAVSRRRF